MCFGPVWPFFSFLFLSPKIGEQQTQRPIKIQRVQSTFKNPDEILIKTILSKDLLQGMRQ